jgi:superfamily I DNA/RNA helicase
MDAVELARQTASDLHARAVALGVDPWRSYEFAVAEVKRRDLDVESTAKGASVLNGGRATFIASERLILHENVGSDFERAFLVAHEIGHVILGDDTGDELVRQIDLERSAEASPVGLDRVIGYGSRQRREVQMDLFAREFLFPRAVARKLHVEDGMTASAIAERLGAPFAVVAQQLLDALLLPPSVQTGESQTRRRAPNAEQRTAAAHRGAPYLLSAGPGTGKTQTLIARVEGLLQEGVDPRRILLLTFSNKAAGEMAERIAAQRPEAAAAMWIGTFHAFGLDVVRRFRTELGFPEDPRMMDRTEAVEILEEEFPRLNLVHYRNLYDPTEIISNILSAISRAKDEMVDAAKYAQLAETMRDGAKTEEEMLAADKALEVARVYEVYERIKRQANCIDFGDLVSTPVRLMEEDPEVGKFWCDQYDHILVDEYQDVNRSSVRLLKALSPTGANLWVVGDARQSIYRFRGASSFNISRFGKEDFVGGKRERLSVNYRSVAEVVGALSQFALQMRSGGKEAALTPDREASGHVPEFRSVDRAEHMPVAVADAIESMRAGGYNYRDQAVLCRGNDKLAELGQDLERLGIPVLFLGSLFERPEIKDLVALLSLLTDRRAMGLVRIACWPEVRMNMPDMAAVLDKLREQDAPPAEWLVDPMPILGLSGEGVVATQKLKAMLEGFDHAAQPWIVLATTLLDRTRIAAGIASSDEVGQRAQGIAIWQFMNFVRVQPGGKGLPIVRLMARIRRLLRLSDERDLRQLPAAAKGIDAVRLMTMHGAKGLEFSVVHIPNLTAASMPGSPLPQPCPPPIGMIEGATGTAEEMRQADHAEEQECLFYVALSRAKDRVFTYAPTMTTDGRSRKLSPFLARLAGLVLSSHGRPSRELPPPPESSDIPLRIHGKLRFESAQIALYESCPRRFFYTHVLHVGGRRASTAFTQMHDAVRTVFKAVIESEEPVSDANLEQRVDGALAAHGLAEHGYADSYRAIALAMAQYFVRTRAGHKPEAPTALSLTFGEEIIIVRPDDVLIRVDGRRTLRRVQTGHKRSKEDEDVGAGAFILAARQAFPDAIVELVHLSDQTTVPIEMSPKVLQSRRKKVGDFLLNIRVGRFPADASVRRCPNCPAFFVCGPTPEGVLERSF